MARPTFLYFGRYSNGKPATPLGTRTWVTAVAKVISHPGFGAGREVCIYFRDRDGQEAPTGVCFVKGRRKAKVRHSLDCDRGR